MADDVRIKIPESGLDGLKALISLGPEGVGMLCEIAKDLPLTLNIKGLTNRLSNELKVEQSSVSQFVMNALMPLNHLRVYLKLETPDFMKLLSNTLEKEVPEKWRTENLAPGKPLRNKSNLCSRETTSLASLASALNC